MLLPETAGHAGDDRTIDSQSAVAVRSPNVIPQHVLITTDGSATSMLAVPPAVAAVEACDSPAVSLLRVLTPTPGSSPMHALDWALAHAQVEADLRELAGSLAALGERVEPVIVEGRAAEQILRYIETHAVDLVVFASHGSSDGEQPWALGSIARKLVASGHTSLLLVPTGFVFRGFRRIVVPLDCSARAELVLPLMCKLAEHHRSEVLLVHAVARPELSSRLPTGERDLELAEELTARNRDRAVSYLDALRDRIAARGIRAHADVLSDVNPARALERYCIDAKADVILLGAHGSGSHAGEAYGSVVRRMIESPHGLLWIVQDLPMTGHQRGERSASTHTEQA
jgi:nucleotide-binding universal stress UspA family protein